MNETAPQKRSNTSSSEHQFVRRCSHVETASAASIVSSTSGGNATVIVNADKYATARGQLADSKTPTI